MMLYLYLDWMIDIFYQQSLRALFISIYCVRILCSIDIDGDDDVGSFIIILMIKIIYE